MLNSAEIATPLGPMLALVSAQGLCLLEFVGQAHIEREIAQVCARHGPATPDSDNPANAANPWLHTLRQELAAYFAQRSQGFSVPLDMVGTPFQQRVWQALLHIPYGQTWSYAQQAAFIGQPTATRAVAHANGQNKISIVIPCHRVIGSNGRLTGYGGGLPRKKALLELEAEQTDFLQGLNRF